VCRFSFVKWLSELLVVTKGALVAAIHISESVIITILTILYIAVRSLRIRPYIYFH